MGEIDTNNMSQEEIVELQKQNCIFCKIAEKQIPSKIIHEDDKVICILDINPASEGHILVYPKDHYMILPHIPDDLLAHLFKTVRLMSNTLLKTLQCSGTSVFIANGMAAGQKAPHVLIHVFPRKMNDGLLKLPSYNMSEDQKRKLKTILENYFIKEFGLSKHNALHNIEKKVTNETDNSDDEKKEHFKKEKNNEYTERKEIEEDEKNKKIEEKPIESSNKIKNSVKKNKLQQKNPVTAKKLEKMTKNKSNKKIDLDDIAKLFS